METSQSSRGHPGYPNYRPYEIEVLKRIKKWGYMRARIGRPQLASWLIPIMLLQFGTSWFAQFVCRRNRLCWMDEQREVHNRLHPLYKHEELK